MSQPGRKPTIYDIARLSGASPSTVSAALSGKGKARRLSEDTVREIQRIALEQGYSTNMQARGLRQARSHLVGMLIPEHDNRFFAALSQAFEAEARARGLCPVIVSTMRDAAEEMRIVETLISFAVDWLFVAGARDPDAIGAACDAAALPVVYVDLPGPGRPSVISDNYRGGAELTHALLDRMPRIEGPRGLPYFLGGVPTDYASARRLEAFRAVVAARIGAPSAEQMILPGYTPQAALREIRALTERLGGLPAALLVNSLTAFEGVLGHFVGLAPEVFAQTAVGCYDYDPFAAFLQFPVHMVRQNSTRLIGEAYALIAGGSREPVMIEIPPDLIAPRTLYPEKPG